jgi:peptidoglycan/xylan/chitin deacetylase (PgdA/CDA1 family)/quercetin dioxygenase-like cupin family protein
MELQRDLAGYGENLPEGTWPGGKRLAISLVVNYEEGSERSFAMGDPDQEALTEWGSYPFPSDTRNLAMESMYEYGSRIGVWRVLDVMRRHQVKSTFFACAVAFEAAPDVARRAVQDGHEICSHGYRWEETFRLTEAEEREHIRLAIDSFRRTCGRRPVGWYCRYGPSVNTRRLLVEEGGFLYDSDSYADDVPYFVDVQGVRHLILPYAADTNDIQYWLSDPLAPAEQFFQYLKGSFDVLYRESEGHPRMMSIGLHCRIIGRPARIGALDRFIEYAKQHEGVWFATREEIARAWLARGDSADADPGEAVKQPVTRVLAENVQRNVLEHGAWSRLLIDADQVPNAQSTMGYASFPSGSVTDPIRHVTEEVCVVVKGSGEIITDIGKVPFSAWDALHIPAGRWHSIASTGDDEAVMVFSFPSSRYPVTERRDHDTPRD